MNTDSNGFIFGFSTIMVLVVAVSLSWVSTSLKPYQKENKDRAKKQSILATVGLNAVKSEDVDRTFDQYIIRGVVLDCEGVKLSEDIEDAFGVDMAVEMKKTLADQRLPLFIARKDGEEFYIVPLRGFGLWDAIWGYLSLQKDRNTVFGAIFDHKSETPGLGAEISTSAFSDMFRGKKLFDDAGKFRSVSVVKGGVSHLKEEDRIYAVDAISGGTITSDGVARMIKSQLEKYVPYLNSNRSSPISSK